MDLVDAERLEVLRLTFQVISRCHRPQVEYSGILLRQRLVFRYLLGHLTRAADQQPRRQRIQRACMSYLADL